MNVLIVIHHQFSILKLKTTCMHFIYSSILHSIGRYISNEAILAFYFTFI